MSYDIIIQNNNLMLTKLNSSMYKDVFLNSLDEDNKRFVPDEVFETIDIAKEVVDSLIKCYENEDGPFIYAVIRKEDAANLGYVQLVKIDEGWEIGYHIAKKYTGNGYATEAVSLFLKYLKENVDIDYLYGICLLENKTSKRVLEKSGFQLIYIGEGMYQGNNREIVKTVIKLK